jgi:hypothetical protein
MERSFSEEIKLLELGDGDTFGSGITFAPQKLASTENLAPRN